MDPHGFSGNHFGNITGAERAAPFLFATGLKPADQEKQAKRQDDDRVLVGGDEEHRDGVLGIGLRVKVEGQFGVKPGAKEARKYRRDEGADGRKSVGVDRQRDQYAGRD